MQQGIVLTALVALLAGAVCPFGDDDGDTEPAWLLPCENPAPLSSPAAADLGYYVRLHDGLDVAAEAARIGSQCGVPVSHVGSDDFSTPHLDYFQFACLRCDPAVESIHVNVIYYPM